MSVCECMYVHTHVFQAVSSAGEKVLSKQKTPTGLWDLADPAEGCGQDVQ